MRVLLLPHGLMPTTFIFLMLLLSAEALPLDSAGVHHHQRFLYDAPFLPASSDRNLFVVGIGDGFDPHSVPKAVPQINLSENVANISLVTKEVELSQKPNIVISSLASVYNVFKRALPTSIATRDLSNCPSGNGAVFTSVAGSRYQILCNTDFPGNDLPYQQVSSFDACVAQCDLTNSQTGMNRCLAAIFVPSRINGADDCYLKYATSTPRTTSQPVEGALLLTTNQNQIAQTSTPSPVNSLVDSNSDPPVRYVSGTSVIVPSIAYTQLHGPSKNQPTDQYIKYTPPRALTLLPNLLTAGIKTSLAIDYGISLDTGVLELNSTTQALLAPLTTMPHISRDGGKGGFLNGQHLFIFCDTGSYTTTTDNTNGNFLGFISSSCATDTGMHALFGQPITLEDGIGEWSDSAGRMRGFAPMTQGEESYNLALQGQGYRYAIWPESSLIPLNRTSALIYAPIVYDVVNQQTRATQFTYTGSTLLTVTAGGPGGPIAERTVNRLWNQDEVEWGCIGGIRSWGPMGIGGPDGRVYIFGNVRGGLLLARTDASDVADRNSYEYWTGNTWSHGMLPASSDAYFISGTFMDVDVFYSPRHLTFLIVYMTIYADSTIYYRYLVADQGILPPFAPGGDGSSDYVENILKYKWSSEQIMYKANLGLSGGYTYAGGVHQGYFGVDDITNGGSKMLLSWTAPTGQDPASINSEYQIITAEVDWH